VRLDAQSFVGQLGKLPLPVRSTPGFLVNRVLMPYLSQAMQLHQEGVPMGVIDQVAVNFGMPMGPIALADAVGLDVCLSVVQTLAQHYPVTVPAELEAMVQAGRLGVKSGEGFYQYNRQGKRKGLKAPHSLKAYADVEDRLILVMLNAAVHCLSEGVVQDTDHLDAGLIFGAGFSPFTGGPIQYARTRGVEDIVQRLRTLSDTWGPLYTPSPAWCQL
jgi:3-hydroxyacyl-CoA dehydrogenase/enoyl-CoA hydratase/3-hydroxybutyryl-CoA epimerase